MLAADQLVAEGIETRVINLHTIKPVDEEIIVKAAIETGQIITAEEHQIIGGLGSTVAEIVTRHHPVPVDMVGMNDRFGESGRITSYNVCYTKLLRSLLLQQSTCLGQT